MTKRPKENEQYEATEAQRRFEQALKGALKTPPAHTKKPPPKKSKRAK